MGVMPPNSGPSLVGLITAFFDNVKHCTEELTHDAIASNRTVAAYRRQIERLGREINSILAQESHHLSTILSLVNHRI